jgi:hypothetical protein
MVAAALLVDGLLGDDLLHRRELGALALRPPHKDPNPNKCVYLALVTARGGGGGGGGGSLRCLSKTASERERVCGLRCASERKKGGWLWA